MGIILDITAKRISKIRITLKPAIEVIQDFVLDGDGFNLLDGDGATVYGWTEE